MKMEFPMPPLKIKGHIDFRLEIDGPMGLDGSVRITGPKDKDKDGNPEFDVKLDFPGEALDMEFKDIEIPIVSALTLGGPALVKMGLDLAPPFPMKSAVTSAVRIVVEQLPKMLGTVVD